MTQPFDHPDHRPEPLQRLEETPVLPNDLEERIVASLRDRGALRPAGAWSRRWYLGGLIAASLVAFLIGRTSTPAGGPEPTAEPRWMLLLYEDEMFQGPAPGREADYVEEYRAWAAGLGRQGTLVDGAELIPGGRFLEPDGTTGVSGDLPLAGAGRLTGYFVIRAPTLDAAAAIATTSPHLAHRGRIAIRPMGAS